MLHHNFLRRILSVSTALCLMFPLSGCDLPFQKQQSDGSGYLFTASLIGNPESLDPQSATDASSMTIIRNLYEGLLAYDENGTLQTAGAQSYTISPDGLTYTFTLSPEQYWYYDANGNDVIDEGESWQVTASDYVYAFQRIFDPATRSPYVQTFSCLQNAAEIEAGQLSHTEIGVNALSDTQLEFTLATPNVRFLSLLASTAAMPCNESFFEQTKGRYGLDQESVASCGAFYLRLWFYDPYGSDNLIYMRRNSANNTVRSIDPANLTFHIRDTLQETTQDFAGDNSDLLVTPVYDAHYMENDRYCVTSVRATTLGLVFQPENEVFANENIRKGLSMAIDRTSIGAQSGSDLAPAAAIIPPAVHQDSAFYRDLVPEPDPTPDTAAAQQTFQTGMQQLEIQSIDTTKILVCQTLMDCEFLHDIIQTWQEVFGFYIGIDEVTEAEYWQRLSEGDYTIAVYGVTGTADDPAAVLEQFRSDVNAFGYAKDDIDAQIDQLRTCPTAQQLLEQCKTLENAILDDAWFVPIFYKNQYCITTSDNADIAFDAFAGTLGFRNAKHFA